MKKEINLGIRGKFIFLSMIVIFFMAVGLYAFRTLGMMEIKKSEEAYYLNSIGLTIELPKGSKTIESSYNNNEIESSTYVENKKLDFYGYIQVWNIEDLDKFLATSKAGSPFDFTNYEQKKVEINNLQGYKIDWEALFKNEQYIKGREYFIRIADKGANNVLRVSFFTKKANFPKELDKLIILTD